MDIKPILGGIAILLGALAYIPYFRDILAGKTKPHAFSWFIWGWLTGIAFFAQVAENGGAGSWVTGLTAVICFVVAGFALKVGRQNIAPIDWLFLLGALVALGLWAITKNPVGSVVLITIIDALAFVPTYRKSFHRPEEETTSTYVFSALKFAIAIPALATLSLTTVLYPLSLVLTNGLFVVMVMLRRKPPIGNVHPY